MSRWFDFIWWNYMLSIFLFSPLLWQKHHTPTNFWCSKLKCVCKVVVSIMEFFTFPWNFRYLLWRKCLLNHQSDDFVSYWFLQWSWSLPKKVLIMITTLTFTQVLRTDLFRRSYISFEIKSWHIDLKNCTFLECKPQSVTTYSFAHMPCVPLPHTTKSQLTAGYETHLKSKVDQFIVDAWLR